MKKLLIITNDWAAYRHYIEENNLKLIDTKRISSLEEVRGYHSPSEYVLLTAPGRDLPEILEYMEYHDIKKVARV
jgi:hypothetical protein